MNTLYFLALLLILLSSVFFFNYEKITSVFQESKPFQTYFEPGKPSEGSINELYQDIFMSLLMPQINKAVYDYYGKDYSVDPWSVKVLSAERLNGYRTFVFQLNLKVIPYQLAHIGVGVDHITIIVDGSGNSKIKNFKHIKSYEEPKHKIKSMR